MNTNPPKTLFEPTIDTQQLLELLKDAAVDDVITYEQMEQKVGRSCRPDGSAYHSLQSAKRMAERDYKKVFDAIPKIGIKCLADGDKVKVGATYVTRTNRVAVRGLKKLACVDYDKLSDAERTKHNVAASHLAVLAEITKLPAIRAIERAVERSQQKLALDETLASFRETAE